MHLDCLKCCAQTFPIQIDVSRPAFSWKIISDGEYGIRQKSYRIIVRKESGEDCWDSGKIDSDETLQVIYEGRELEPDTRYIWEVTAWTDPSDVLIGKSWFETGLMKKQWKAKWIGYDALQQGMRPFDKNVPFYCADDFEQGENEYYLPPAPYLRREFEITGSVSRAKIYISALGIADVKINGREITEEKFIPGTANYDNTVWSKSYDVTEHIRSGTNAIGVILADGWFAGYVGLHNREWYGSKPRVMIQLVLTMEDGSREIITSDEKWRAHYGAVLEADIFQGECYDATKELTGYSEHGFDDCEWKPVETGSEHELIPEAHPGIPMVEYEAFEAGQIIRKNEDTVLVDLGKLISGVLRITVCAKPNAKIQIRHAEILKPDGSLHLAGNRSARAMDTYICNGNGVEIFKPRFTYHGFRYAEITGIRGAELLKAEGIPIGSELPDRTEFESSDVTLNKVFMACRDTMLCNLMDNPTDVCARDERLGWGMEGDHAAASTAMLGNMELFIRKWNRDIWSSQHEDGSLEPIAPPLMMKDIEQFIGDLQTNHGIRMIYTLYKVYGDKEIVREYYPSMEKFFRYLENNSDRYIRFGTTGDWLGLWEKTDHSDVNHGYGDCSPGIVGTTHYANIIRMMIEMSEGIGKENEAEKYRGLYQKVKKAFAQNFIQRDGTIRFGKQGEYVLALAAGMVPKEYEQLEAEELKRKLTEKGRVFWKGGTPSTPYFLDTLKRYGYTEEAVEFLTSGEFPSIGYMIDKGPGTIWERWDGIWEDGSLHPQVMNAMCHIGLTVVDEYLVTGLAGITPLKPGYHQFEVAPALSEKLEEVKTVYQSKSGTIKVHWTNKEKSFRIQVVVPPNTEAIFKLPCRKGTVPKTNKGEIENILYGEKQCSFCVKSGEYDIEILK